MVHSSPVSSAYLECRRLNDPILSQRAGKRLMKKKKNSLPFHLHQLPFHTLQLKGQLSFLTAPAGDGDDEKRSSKQGEVKRSGVRERYGRDAGPPPRYAVWGRGGGGEGFRVIGAGNLRAAFSHRDKGLHLCRCSF